jgi:hypothetical protein
MGELAPVEPAEDGGAWLQTRVSLLPRHREQLQKSGLTDNTIELSGVYSVATEDEARRLLGLAPGALISVPALAFPYPDCEQYVRLRPDSSTRPNPDYREPRDHELRPNGDLPRYLEGPKYLSPSGVPTRLYMPTKVCPDILTPGVKLWLTEGEKKALAGCQAGLAVVGAPGVSCFGDSAIRHRAKGVGQDVRRLHADFGRLSVNGREVVIVFDSDIDEKAQILAAAATLGKMLADAGALPRISYLESRAAGEKLGLDDFLAAEGNPERRGPEPRVLLEEAVRPFNVEECVSEFLAPKWEDWTTRQQGVELGRAVRLACHLFEKKADLDGWCRRVARALREKVDYVRTFIVEVKKTSPADPRSWLEDWAARHQLTYSCRTETLSVDGKQVTSEAVFREMALDAVTWGGPPRLSIQDAFSRWMDSQRERAADRLREKLTYRDGLGDKALLSFVQAVTGATDTVDVVVVKHFIWQVKRRLYGLPVEDHVMPILYGPQRAGKSRAINALLRPVEDFVDAPGDLATIIDERQVFRMTQCYVLVFDEMAKAKKADVDLLKNRITQDTVRWRILGSNRRASGPNNATFIGATNTSLLDLIYDPTGVRRFYEIKCQARLDWDAINTLDYGDVWASVDERAVAPVKEVMDVLKARQEEMRVKDAVEEFLASCCIVGGGTWTAGKDVFEAFKAFLEADRRTKEPWNSSRFGFRLKELLGPDLWKKSDGIKYGLGVRNSLMECNLDTNEAQRPLPSASDRQVARA